MIGSTIRTLRVALGYTQTDLAHLSKVSLPSIQNIEANKANPSWDTIEKIFDVLGIELNTNIKKANWDVLACLGVPIMAAGTAGGKANKSFKPSSSELIKNIKLACLELFYDKKARDYERKKEAVEALLLAIKHHYPTFYKTNVERSEIMLKFIPNNTNGRWIKLERIALSTLSTYL